MTTQSLISAQSVGTSTNIGNNKFSINPVTLAAGTTAFVINAQLTTPSTTTALQDKGQALRVWYTTTIRTVTAANAPFTLGQTARYVDIRPGQVAGLAFSIDSTLEPKTGSLLHCWCDVPAFTVAHTLSVDVVELPS